MVLRECTPESKESWHELDCQARVRSVDPKLSACRWQAKLLCWPLLEAEVEEEEGEVELEMREGALSLVDTDPKRMGGSGSMRRLDRKLGEVEAMPRPGLLGVEMFGGLVSESLESVLEVRAAGEEGRFCPGEDLVEFGEDLVTCGETGIGDKVREGEKYTLSVWSEYRLLPKSPSLWCFRVGLIGEAPQLLAVVERDLWKA